MMAKLTGMNRDTQMYCCRFGWWVSCINWAKSDYQECVKYIKVNDCFFSFKEAHYEHYHNVGIKNFKSHFYTCTSKELD